MENEKSKNSNHFILEELENIIFNLDTINIESSVQRTMNLFDENFPCSSKFTICIFIYSAFSAQRETESTYFTYLQSIQKKSEEINKGDPMIFEVFGRIIIKNRTQESYYLIEKMIERNLLDSKIAESINSIYFAHYHTIKESQQLIFDPFYEYFKANLERLSKNNWELHKKFVSKGVNPSKIAKVIRKDNIEKLQKIISSTPSFEFNQKIQPSLYERYSYISNRNISLVNYAAFFGSIKCFKYLLLNNAILENTSKYAVAGGNIEIVKICEQSHLSFEGSYEVAIKFHRNDIFHYIYENKLENINQEYKDKDVLSAHLLFSYGDIKRDIISFRVMCINFCNFEILKFLSGNKYGISDEELKYALISGNLFLVKCILENKIENESVIAYAADSGNIELVKYFIGKNEHIHNVNSADSGGSTPLIYASQNGYVDIVKFLLEQKGININAKNNIGWTSLMLAAGNSHIEVLKLLLERKEIQLDVKDLIIKQH